MLDIIGKLKSLSLVHWWVDGGRRASQSRPDKGKDYIPGQYRMLGFMQLMAYVRLEGYDKVSVASVISKLECEAHEISIVEIHWLWSKK